MRFSYLLALLCLPCFAWAQTSTLSISLSGSTSFNASACGSQIGVAFTGTLDSTACNLTALQIFVTNATTCPSTGPSDAGTDDAPSSGLVDPATFQATPTGTVQIAVDDTLPIFSGSDGGACGVGAQVQGEMLVCGHFTAATGGLTGTCTNINTDVSSNGVQIVYDSQPPTPPTLGGGAVSGVDSALNVTASSLDTTDPLLDATSVNFYYRQFDAGTAFVFGVSSQISGSTDVAGTIGGLQNGTTYEVVATAVDPSGNESAFSDSETGTPQPTFGFWSHYQSDGGQEKGGCAAAGGSWGLMALAPTLWALWRRNRR